MAVYKNLSGVTKDSFDIGITNTVSLRTNSGILEGQDSGGSYAALLMASLGRAGGQEIIGGTASGENLTLTSTSNVTKGSVISNDDIIVESGVLALSETTTPTPVASYGRVYTKSDNTLYFQDGAGSERPISSLEDVYTVSPVGGDYSTIQAALDANTAGGELFLVSPGTYTDDTIAFTANDQCVCGLGCKGQQILTTASANIVDFGAFTNCYINSINLTVTAATSTIDTVTGSTGNLTIYNSDLAMTNSSVTTADQPTCVEVTSTGIAKVIEGSMTYTNNVVAASAVKAAVRVGTGSEVDLDSVDVTIAGAGTSTATVLNFGSSSGITKIKSCRIDITDTDTGVGAALYLSGSGANEIVRNYIDVEVGAGVGYGVYASGTVSVRSMFNHIEVSDTGGTSYAFFFGSGTSTVSQFDDILADDEYNDAGGSFAGVISEEDGELEIYRTSDPTLEIHNFTAEDIDGGREGSIKWHGEQSGGEISALAKITASHDGASDDEQGNLSFQVNDGNDGETPTERFSIDSNGLHTVTGSMLISTLNTANGIMQTDGSGNLSTTLTPSGLTSLSATDLTGTLQTAAQTNITSLGTLTGLTVSGDITTTGASIDWDLADNSASALSFDSTGSTGLIEIVTTDISPGVNMSGFLNITGDLDVGASPFSVNSIEIVGADGEVNKSAVEDSGNWDTAYNHSQDNTQAHTDYLLNSGDDTTSGTITMAGGIISADTATITHSGTTSLTVASTSGNVLIEGATFNGTAVTGLSALTSTALTGTLQTASQTNITGVGTLTSLTTAPKLTISDSATTAPLNITERSAAPSSPASNDVYLDDGTNTASTNPGWRRYTGAVWEDVTAAAGGGGGSTLQASYDASTSPEFTLDGTRGAITIRDAATPIAANLLEVQNNAGSTSFFTVTDDLISTDKRIEIPTTSSSTVGLITQNGVAAYHNYGTNNTWMAGSGNFTMTGTGQNLGIGSSALVSTTTGVQNVAIGYLALTSSTTASNCVAIGSGAMYSNVSGNEAFALGYSALFNNAAPTRSVGIGYQALQGGGTADGTGNIGIGYRALASYTEASATLAIGNEALSAITTGYHNLALGFNAGVALTTGYQNTIIGVSSGGSLVGAYHNTFIGRATGASVTGNGNVIIGDSVANTQTSISNELWIDNANNAAPLIHGDFSDDIVTINGTLTVADILRCVSSDIAHGLTTTVATDTYFTLGKLSATGGGTQLISVTDGDETSSIAFEIDSYCRDTADTTDSTAGVGVITFNSFQHDGADTASAVADAGNLAVFRNNSSTRLIIKGDGDVEADGTVTSTSFDFAEMMETYDGKPIAPGTPVVIDSGRFVREATRWEKPLGVVSATAGYICNDPMSWQGRYKKDNFGEYVRDDNGNRVETDEFDPSKQYTKRSSRDEWVVVGLVGQVYIKNGSVTDDRWIKLEQTSDESSLWLIR